MRSLPQLRAAYRSMRTANLQKHVDELARHLVSEKRWAQTLALNGEFRNEALVLFRVAGLERMLRIARKVLNEKQQSCPDTTKELRPDSALARRATHGVG